MTRAAWTVCFGLNEASPLWPCLGGPDMLTSLWIAASPKVGKGQGSRGVLG